MRYIVYCWVILIFSSQLAVAESNFTDTLEPTRTIPVGANLGVVAEYINRKVRLTKEVKEKVFFRRDSLSPFIATTELTATSPILRKQVAARPTKFLQTLIPPGRKLFTLRLPPSQTHYTSLCDQFTAAKLEVVKNIELSKSKTILSEDIRIISSSTSKKNDSDDQTIVVIALKPQVIDKLRKAQKDQQNIHVRCSAASKYE